MQPISSPSANHNYVLHLSIPKNGGDKNQVDMNVTITAPRTEAEFWALRPEQRRAYVRMWTLLDRRWLFPREADELRTLARLFGVSIEFKGPFHLEEDAHGKQS